MWDERADRESRKHQLTSLKLIGGQMLTQTRFCSAALPLSAAVQRRFVELPVGNLTAVVRPNDIPSEMDQALAAALSLCLVPVSAAEAYAGLR